MLFWLSLFLIIAALSFLLARRSVKNAEVKIKPMDGSQSLFLIRLPEAFNEQILIRLHQQNLTFGLEKLFKGEEEAMAIFGPPNLETDFPELGLLELEDYLIPKEQTFAKINPSKVNADQAFIWKIPIKPGMGRSNLFSDLNLSEDEQFFFQLILQPLPDKKEQVNEFKVTTRALAATKDRLDKVKLAKRIFTNLSSKLGLRADLHPIPESFEKYQFRLPEGDIQFNIPQLIRFLSF